MPVVLHVLPPSVDSKICWPLASPSSVLEFMNTWLAAPPASHGRSPLWQYGVPRSQVVPPSGDEKIASLARSIPVLYRRPLASNVRSGSLKPVLISGLVGHVVPR